MDTRKVRNLTIHLWCILIYLNWGNQINQSKNHNLLYEAHGIKQPKVALHQHEVLHLVRIQLGSHLDAAAGTGKTILTSLAIRGNWESRCFQHLIGPRRTDHQEILLLVVCLRVVSRHLWDVFAQKTLCNGAIKIVAKVSPNFGCLFLRNNTVLLDGMHDCRSKR